MLVKGVASGQLWLPWFRYAAPRSWSQLRRQQPPLPTSPILSKAPQSRIPQRKQSPLAWPEQRVDHDNEAKYRIASCSEGPAPQGSTPLSLPLRPCSFWPFRIAPFLRLFLCGFQTVSQLFPAVCSSPAAALLVDGSAHFSTENCPYFRFWLERKNAWHFSDHVVCRVDVSTLCFDVLTFSQHLNGQTWWVQFWRLHLTVGLPWKNNVFLFIVILRRFVGI